MSSTWDGMNAGENTLIPPDEPEDEPEDDEEVYQMGRRSNG